MLMTSDPFNLAANVRLVDPPDPTQTLAERRRWLMLAARPGKEADAADLLRLRAVGVYWPNYFRQTQWPTRANGYRRRTSRCCSIMPGYLFAPMDMADTIPWQIIETTPGVLQYLRDGSGNPAFLLPADIEIIRKIEDGLNTPLPKDLRHGFKTGDRARFTDDLTGRWPPGRVVLIEKSGRISVETVLLGRSVTIRVLPHQIERI